MRAIRCMLAAFLAAGIVTVVAAQPGTGGFGRGGGDVETLVFTNAALQEELKITDAQKDKFKPVSTKLADLSKKRSEMFGKGGKGGFDKEKFTELQEEGKKVAEEAKKVRDEVLTADQKKRLKQIGIQVMSFQVFSDPEAKTKGGFGGASEAQKATMKEVQDALKLSESQLKTVRGAITDYNKERQEINKEAGIGGFGKQVDPEKKAAADKKIDKSRKEAWLKIEEALDATQKTAWKGLVGDAFDTSKLAPAPAPKKD
ncbi:MAG: hypothetical protein FJ304_04845 [Planctomycetes bacterium]|nr:hypothetical protein [Planctomycetota bacterium]